MQRAAVAVIIWLALFLSAQAQNCVISGSTINGTVEQRCVIIGPTPPGLSVVESLPIRKLPNGQFEQRLIVQLTGGYSPPQMVLAMKGDNIVFMRAMPALGGVSMIRNGQNGDVHFSSFQNPVPGKYFIEALTNSDTPVTFLSQLN